MLPILAALLLQSVSPTATPIHRRLAPEELRFVDAGNRLAALYAEYGEQFAAGRRDVKLERKLARALREFENLLLPPDAPDSRTGCSAH